METGVYKIRNITNNDIYIGSAQISFNKRKTQHWSALRKNKHHSRYLQNAINKYGIENFLFEIIEECLPEICLIREQFWLDTLSPKYNINRIAKSRKGCRHSKESIMKMIISQNRRKHIISEEGKNIISKTHKGINKTKEHVEKVKNALYKAILQLNMNDEPLQSYLNANEACIKNGWKDPKHIQRACRGDKNRKIAYGYKWKYI